ncbi:MAG TPA: efflux RND transporter periplasmic adaptor subunit [Candidatus Avidesulfovibrio excrementigallinarum]|nr:efflux RND transporter periplasmic adaptor subunit [Candidatus Avidesulfovibrio excrementigallinarum]
MKKWLIILLVLVVAGAGGWYGFLYLHGGAEPFVLYGNVDIRQVSLAFNSSGRIRAMTVEEGDQIHAGQVLARLDDTSLRLQADKARADIAALDQALLRLLNGTRPEELAQARASVAAAQAEATFTAQQRRRMQALFSGGSGHAVSRQELDNAISADDMATAKLRSAREALRLAEIGPRDEDIAQARAQLESAKAQLAILEHDIAETVLLSPCDGVIRSRLLEPGDMASPQRAVYLVALTSPKWIRAYVSEPQLGLIHEGMRLSVTTDSWPDDPVTGTVGFIASVAEFTPKTVQTEELRSALLYEVRVLVDDPDNRLRLGMPATVRLADEGSGTARRP